MCEKKKETLAEVIKRVAASKKKWSLKVDKDGTVVVQEGPPPKAK